MTSWPDMRAARKDSIGGLTAPCDQSDLIAYIAKVNSDVQALDGDIETLKASESTVKDPKKFSAYALLLLQWPLFKTGMSAPIPGSTGWDTWVKSNAAPPLYPLGAWTTEHAVELWNQAEAYHRKMASFWDTLVAAGGKPSFARPTQFGCDLKGTAPPDLNTGAKTIADTILTVGLVGAAVYVAVKVLGGNKEGAPARG